MLQPTPGYVSTTRPATLARWLWCVAALIVAIIPPLNDAQWQAEFAGYQRIPEYQQLNRGMTLAGFKAIFFWEYIHRVLGRVIGLAFALPLIWFAVKRRDRLVDGQLGPVGAHRREPHPPRGPSDDCARDPLRDRVDRARSQRAVA